MTKLEIRKIQHAKLRKPKRQYTAAEKQQSKERAEKKYGKKLKYVRR